MLLIDPQPQIETNENHINIPSGLVMHTCLSYMPKQNWATTHPGSVAPSINIIRLCWKYTTKNNISGKIK